jgi:hypothetical protein
MRKQLLCVAAVLSMAVLTIFRGAASADSTGKKSNNVKLYTNAVEVVDVQPTAEKCAKSKGTTIRLRVTSESPVDIKLYSPGSFGKNWIDKDFPNQKKGDEITDFMCGNSNAAYKVYTRAAGSSDAWSRP